MNDDEVQMIDEMASGLMRAGKVDALVSDLEQDTDGEMWESAVLTTRMFGTHGYLGLSSRLRDLAILRSDEWPGGVPAFVWPALATDSPPGCITGSRVEVDGIVFGMPTPSTVVVAIDSGDLFAIASDALDFSPLGGHDSGLGPVSVRGIVHLDDCREISASGDWESLSCRAVRVVAAELLGVARRALDTAKDHVETRKQFGNPLSSLQVVRHRLVNASVAVSGAEALLTSTADTSFGSDMQISLVKAAAGRAALEAVQAAQQVCGAIGFTEEFGLHAQVWRAYFLDSLFGGSEAADRLLGSFRGGAANDSLSEQIRRALPLATA